MPAADKPNGRPLFYVTLCTKCIEELIHHHHQIEVSLPQADLVDAASAWQHLGADAVLWKPPAPTKRPSRRVVTGGLRSGARALCRSGWSGTTGAVDGCYQCQQRHAMQFYLLRLTAEVRRFVLDIPNLCSWFAPDQPEAPVLYRGECALLWTVGHEQLVGLLLSREAPDALGAAGLDLAPRRSVVGYPPPVKRQPTGA